MGVEFFESLGKIGGILVVGMVSFIVGVSIPKTTSISLKVGDCVRELGFDASETVDFITDGGAIETNFIDGFGIKRTAVYETSKKLIKVDCK